METWTCPRCGHHITDTTTIRPDDDVSPPRPGDLGVCIRCAAPIEYRADGGPRWLTYDEAHQLPTEISGQMVAAIITVLTLRWPEHKEP
jgi:hypothetical protein